jgi:1,4-dihydroxy-2-naphthoyl-CoA hydrolase
MTASDHGDEPQTESSQGQAAAGTGWIEAIGLELTRVTAELVLAEWNLEPKHLQPHGIVHGGVYASVVETCCSLGAGLAAPAGKVVVGVENHTSFIRQARQGRLRARAAPIHAGRRAQLWECSIFDAAERLIATGRLRVMCVDMEPER